MIGSLSAHAKQLIQRGNKRAFVRYAEAHQFVYFGHVDQHDDDHRLIRGLTLSPQHNDDHYCVGSVDSYDLALVERTDTISGPNHKPLQFRWVIAAIDFSTEVELPHIFLGLHSHSALFYEYLFTKFRYLQPLEFGALHTASDEFQSTYKVYVAPADAIEAERILTPDVTHLIAQHFGILTCEITDGVLYVYSEHPTVNAELLDAMIKNGVWLVKEIEKNVAIQKQRHSDEVSSN